MSHFESDTRMNYRLVLRAECAISQGQNNSVNSVAHDGWNDLPVGSWRATRRRREHRAAPAPTG